MCDEYNVTDARSEALPEGIYMVHNRTMEDRLDRFRDASHVKRSSLPSIVQL